MWPGHTIPQLTVKSLDMDWCTAASLESSSWVVYQGACCTDGWLIAGSLNTREIHGSTFCSCWSAPSFLDQSETSIDCTWIQTADGDYIYARFLWLTVNNVIIIDKIHVKLLSLLWMEHSSWSKVLHSTKQLDRSTWLSVHAAGLRSRSLGQGHRMIRVKSMRMSGLSYTFTALT